jgi:hypothetical protein
MAKTHGTVATTTEHKIEGFAEDLGKMLGRTRNKAEGWLSQRDAIVRNLTQLRDETTKLLTQLGHDTAAAVTRVRRGRRPAALARTVRKFRDAASTPVVRKRRKMSKAARAAISAAQKLRWAKQKARDKK